jgi:predicted pyridoxine 5'-phosphate oxidase superfamily flavin-nucleotide-binding protein
LEDRLGRACPGHPEPAALRRLDHPVKPGDDNTWWKSEADMTNNLDDTRWNRRRDPSARDEFVIAVNTTRIYCRPGCPARQPLRKNVAFFETPEPARAAGFRACKRCKPDT